jgi:hypothetical protein
MVELADGYLAALNCLKSSGVHIFNLGMGKGLPVLDMVNSFVLTPVSGIKESSCGVIPRTGAWPKVFFLCGRLILVSYVLSFYLLMSLQFTTNQA